MTIGQKWKYRIAGGIVLVILVVVGFLAVSLSIVRERGQRTACLGNLKQIGLGFNLYAADHKESLPTNVVDLTRYMGGNDNARMFFCPSRIRHLKDPFPRVISSLKDFPEYQSYDYLNAVPAIPRRPVFSTFIPIMCDKPGNHGERFINILFGDGHVGWWEGTIEDYGRSNNLVITVRTDWVK